MIPYATLAKPTTSYKSYPEIDDGQMIIVICLDIVIFALIEVSAPSYQEHSHEINGRCMYFSGCDVKKRNIAKIIDISFHPLQADFSPDSNVWQVKSLN